jgi:hypothetical protein
MVCLLRRFAAVLAIVISGAGCFPDATGTTPNANSEYFYYPIALGLTQPDGRYLLVASSNFDLLYNSGTLMPIDLEPVLDVVEACREGQDGAGCSRFLVPREEDVRDDEYQVVDFVLEDHGVLIGSYAAALAVTEGMALVTVRADASLHFVDVAEVAREDLDTERVLRCSWGEDSTAPGGLQSCGGDRRARSGRRIRDDEPISVPAEPFGVVAWHDAETDFAVVSHMVGGEVSLFERLETPPDLPIECGDAVDNDGDGLDDSDDPGCRGPAYQLIDVSEDFDEGTTGIAVDDDGDFLATSRFTTSLTYFRVDTGAVTISETIAVDATDSGDNQRGIAISPGSDRAFVVSRSPESLLVVDLTAGSDVDPSERFVAVIEIGGQPSLVRVYEEASAVLGYMVYVMCFSDDQIYVVDPSINEVVDVISTRRGPHDLVFDQANGVGYLANFLESTVSVVDVDPESPRYHTILTTLGKPRRPRSND